MHKLFSALLLGSLATASASANPAVFRDSYLLIDEAVTLTGDTPQYFKNVQLEVLPTGQLVLLNADPRTLAVVQETSVAVLQTEPVQVELRVAGEFSDPCVQLEPVSVSMEGNTFHVVIAETPPDPAALCLAQVVPYEIVIPLDVRNLLPRNYHIRVNGNAIDFDLE